MFHVALLLVVLLVHLRYFTRPVWFWAVWLQPFSKLLQAPRVFFSPSRTQIDNARDKRYRP